MQNNDNGTFMAYYRLISKFCIQISLLFSNENHEFYQFNKKMKGKFNSKSKKGYAINHFAPFIIIVLSYTLERNTLDFE